MCVTDLHLDILMVNDNLDILMVNVNLLSRMCWTFEVILKQDIVDVLAPK